jgi:hypothetical protein
VLLLSINTLILRKYLSSTDKVSHIISKRAIKVRVLCAITALREGGDVKKKFWKEALNANPVCSI